MSNYGKKKGNTISVLSREEYLRKLAASEEPLDIKLTNNYAFRKVFKNKKVLKGFLMVLLKLKESEIIDIEVIDPFELGENESEKEGILDIKIHLNNSQKINIEMQNRYQEDWSERTLFYNCRMFVEGYEHGKAYSEMESCIHVGILNFVQMESPGFHHKIMLLDEKTSEVYSSKFIFHVLELKKLDGMPESERDELYRWACLIAANSWKEVCEEAEGNPYMEEVKEEMKKISQDEKERYLYLREAMALSDEASRIITAKNEGIKEGIKAGIILLIQKKLAKGKSVETIAEEVEESVEVVKQLIAERPLACTKSQSMLQSDLRKNQ